MVGGTVEGSTLATGRRDMKTLLLIMDGVGDRGRDTSLSRARTPHLDELAKAGITGMLPPLGRGIVPGSDTSHLAILGYDPKVYYKGRGAFEAFGAGLELKDKDVAFRTNLGTADENLVVTDRRAGRDPLGLDELYAVLDGMEFGDVRLKIKHTVEHRGALVLSGPGLSAAVSNTDPHEVGVKLLESKALAPDGEKTASVLNQFTEQARAILSEHPVNKMRQDKGKVPANVVLSRGAGIYFKPESFAEKYGLKAVCIAGGALYKGAARYVGMDVPDVPGATGTTSTDLHAKAAAVRTAVPDYDFVFVHVKGTDAAAHDGNAELKCRIIERVDGDLIADVAELFDIIIVTGDHSTPPSAKRHSADPVPILFWHADVRSDKATRLCESECMNGGLGHMLGLDIMPLVLDYLGKSEMFGE